MPTARPYLKRVATIERAGHAVNAYVSCCAMSPLLPSGRVLQGEFAVAATPGFHHSPLSIVREPLLLPFIASEYAQCPAKEQYSMGDSRVSMTIMWLDEHLFLR